MDIFKECPTLENGNYIIRLIEKNDAQDLFDVYSDKYALPFFNSDNCHGSNFYCANLEDVKNTIKYWLIEYRENRGFVRFSIVDKRADQVIGTMEMFRRESEDFYDQCGILRVDVASGHEKTETLSELFSLVTEPFYEWFDCTRIATKAAVYAVDRIEALIKAGYQKSDQPLIGRGQNRSYYDYWVSSK